MLSKQTDSQAVLFPEILEIKQAGHSLVMILRIPEDLAYFAGHFDEIPVVPGVVQIQWAMHYARERLGVGGEFIGMEVIKFKELLLPGQCLALNLDYQPESCKLTFSFASETTEYSSGRIYLHDRTL